MESEPTGTWVDDLCNVEVGSINGRDLNELCRGGRRPKKYIAQEDSQALTESVYEKITKVRCFSVFTFERSRLGFLSLVK